VDWEQVDLTLDAVIGGEEQPGMLAGEVRRLSHSNLYQDLFRTDRDGLFLIVDDHELGREEVVRRERDAQGEDNAANSFMVFFGRFPAWTKTKYNWLNGAMAGGDCCDRCMVKMNLLNASQLGCCDACESEMNEQIMANPDVVFAFERGGLRAVA
jgi:hypothetical protein